VSKIERSIVIDRPVDEVFNFVHDPRNDASWQTTLIESTQVDDGPLRVGTQIRERRRFLGIQVEMTKEITEFEPTRRSAFTMVAGGAPMSGAYTLKSLDGATKLTATGYVEPRGFFKIARPRRSRVGLVEEARSQTHKLFRRDGRAALRQRRKRASRPCLR
jgi:uncharacterized membrane protein